MIRLVGLLASLSLTLGLGQSASAQPAEGQGVLINCPVTHAVLSSERALFTCAGGFSDIPGLSDEAELVYGSSADNLWLAERAIGLMAAAAHDTADRPLLRFNILYRGPGRPGLIMDVRSAWTPDTPTGRTARPGLTRLVPGSVRPGTSTAARPGSGATPSDGQGLELACHLTEIALLPDRARFTCADGFNSGWSGLSDEVDLRHDMTSNSPWLIERAIDLLATAPRDSANRPVLHLNILYRGPGTPAYAMDVRAQY